MKLRQMMSLCVAVCIFMAVVRVLPAVDGQNGTSGTPTLKDILEKGLRARRPEEFAFIATVLAKVDRGDLPRDVVQSTFLWARRQPSHPYQYFEEGLRQRAKKIGVVL